MQLLGPTMERDGARLRLCFSFHGLAGCVQGPGVNLFFLAVRGWESVWVEKTVKVLKQLLQEAANTDFAHVLA